MQGIDGQYDFESPRPPQQFTMPPTALDVPATARLSGGAVFGQTVATFAIATIAAFVVGCIAGGIAGILLVQDLDDWAALTGIFIAILLGIAVMLATYVIVAIWLTHRAIPAGQRVAPISGLLLGPPVALPVTWIFIGEIFPVLRALIP